MKRRLDKRIPILLVLIFFATFSLSFIKNNHIDSTEAASFNAGNIISNYVMGNYNSMSVSEIQAFLDSKSRCNTANLSGGYYSGNQYVKNLNRTYYWHLDDNGNFICLNREKFDDEGKIGTGKTAAELIYEFAQEYKINPQVILVLLQKEQGLLTDPYPNNFDYGWALGFGAYDYGEWNTKYAGFKEQLRAAFDFYSWFVYEYDEDEAWWSVDPEKSEYYIRLGQSNILYNPDYSCGADLVYIENTATVSLYVYTPYQPNSIVRSGQLDEVCGAYGNWNFFNYFNNYFGDPAITHIDWYNMETPRFLMITPNSHPELSSDEIDYYVRRTIDVDGDLCLQKESDMKQGINKCTKYSLLEEVKWNWIPMETPRKMQASKSSGILKMNTKSILNNNIKDKIYYFDKKIIFEDYLCLHPQDYDDNTCIAYSTLQELLPGSGWQTMDVARELTVSENIYKINARTGQEDESFLVTTGTTRKFVEKIYLADGSLCLKTEYDYNLGTDNCIRFSKLSEAWNNLTEPISYSTIKDVYKINAFSQKEDYSILMDKGMTRNYISRILISGNVWCMRTEYDHNLNTDNCVKITNLKANWMDLSINQIKTIKNEGYKINSETLEEDFDILLSKGMIRTYVRKKFLSDETWCYQTEYDYDLGTNNCIEEKLF